MLAAALPLAVVCGGCRSVIDSSQSLAELTASSSKEKPKSSLPSFWLTSKPSEEDSASDASVQSAETLLAANVIQSKQDSLRPQRVESRGWYADSGIPLYYAFLQGTHRWRHQNLEQLIDQPDSPHQTLLAGKRSSNLEVRSTALIGLIRTGYDQPADQLDELIRNPSTSPATKGALLEAMTYLPISEIQETIKKLYADREKILPSEKKVGKELVSQLDEQFWIALAEVTPSIESDARFVDQFDRQSPEIQAAILDLLLVRRVRQVPEPIAKHFARSSTQAMHRLNLWPAYLRSVAPLETLAEERRSADFASRESAIIGMGRDASEAALIQLEQIDDDDPTLIQVASVIAWRLTDAPVPWSRLAAASSWRVRLAVAQLIPLDTKDPSVFAKLQEDNSRQVRDAMAKRSPARAFKSQAPTETNATAQRAKQVKLTPDQAMAILEQIEQAQHAQRETQRTEARQALLLEPEKVLAAVQHAAEPLSSYDNAYLFEVLLPQCDPAYQELQEAISDNRQLALVALRQLAQRASQGPLPELIVWRLYRNVEQFTPMNWQVMMELIRDDERAAAQNITRRALACEDSQVRVSAYHHIARFPLDDVESQLRDGLKHQMPAVRIAALDALSVVAGGSIREDVMQMLTDSDVDVQLAACRALDKLNDARGINHLRRMTYASNKVARLASVKAIAARNDRSDVPTLIRMLHDDTAVRAAALDGLSSIIPENEQPTQVSKSNSIDAQCVAWKNWFDRQSFVE